MKNNPEPSPEQLLSGLERLLEAPAEPAAAWPELERWTRGELDEREIARLEARSETDPALQRALSAHRPLGSDISERISQAVLATPPGSVAGAVAKPSALRSRRRVFWAAAPALAAAAALALWLQSPSFEPLARYSVEVQGAAVSSRGAEAAAPAPQTLRVEPQRELTLLLRPAVPDQSLAEARVFIARGGQPVPLHANVARSGSGALRVVLRVPDVSEPARLLIVVARPGVSMPEVASAPADAGPGWQRFGFKLDTQVIR